MSEHWMAHRQAVAAALQGRARATGSVVDSRVWEEYVRKTSAMTATAHALQQTLPPQFQVAHGLRVIYQGKEIYLEHVVTGPTGIYLMETQSEGDEAWRKDLGQNMAFFRGLLGVSAHFFAALVVMREPLREPLPPGAHAVESVEVAVAVMTQEGGIPVSPVMIDQVWANLQALQPTSAQAPQPQPQPRPPHPPRAGAPASPGAPQAPVPPYAPAPYAPVTLPQPPADKSLPRLIWASVILAFLANLSCSVGIGGEDRTLMFVVGLFLVVGPAAGIAALIKILPWPGARKGGLIAWVVIVGLVFLLMLLMAFTYEKAAAAVLA